MAENSKLDEIWNLYPADRQRNRDVSLNMARAVIEEGEISSDELTSAVAAYAVESAGYTRSKVSYSDNWFSNNYWQKYLDKGRTAGSEKAQMRKEALARLAEWVDSKSGLCRTISRVQAEAILQDGLVSSCQLQAAGVDL